jgi:chromosome segregation ATPase
VYLEKLEVQGFKSFVHKTSLEFPQPRGSSRRGIAAIVGPNGSGKSNLADAIRWVMGEQSMKSLRGKKSEDVIFSGSDKLSRVGLAEVSLILNNEDRRAPVDYSQIVISRRLYRSGESEYLLNKQKTRLQDITMLLAQAQFGAKTYSIISQGMVDAFLMASPLERKEYFDEAAGTRPLQIKKEEAEHKLELAEQNLQQGDMLINEITPRLKSLTRQVKRLEKREEVAAQLRELQIKYFGSLLHEVKESLAKEAGVLEEIAGRRNKASQQVKDLENQFAGLAKETPSGDRYAELELAHRALWEKKTALRERLAEIKVKLSSLAVKADAAEKNNVPRAKLTPIFYELEATITRLSELVSSDLPEAKQELASLIQKLNNHLGSLRAEVIWEDRAGASQISELEEAVKKLLVEEKQLDQSLAEAQTQMKAFHAKEDEKNKSFFELEKKLQQHRQELSKIIDEENDRQVAAARLSATEESVSAAAREDLGELPNHEEYAALMSELEKEQLRRQIEQFKNQVATIGAIDPETQKEYEETQARYDFLSGQAEDLRKGIVDLRKVIADLDDIIDKQFNAAFQKIGVNFEHFFKILFNGGYAKLVKVPITTGGAATVQVDDEEGEVEVVPEKKTIERLGIDIQATPPGKRLKNISMLSGGERALTSLALVCAIISNNPSPFVVLDEVDAALDEANATRFAEIIESLSHQTQFIVVTHSRATMHQANILYGVTMGEDGASKVLSLKMEDVESKE